MINTTMITRMAISRCPPLFISCQKSGRSAFGRETRPVFMASKCTITKMEKK